MAGNQPFTRLSWIKISVCFTYRIYQFKHLIFFYSCIRGHFLAAHSRSLMRGSHIRRSIWGGKKTGNIVQDRTNSGHHRSAVSWLFTTSYRGYVNRLYLARFWAVGRHPILNHLARFCAILYVVNDHQKVQHCLTFWPMLVGWGCRVFEFGVPCAIFDCGDKCRAVLNTILQSWSESKFNCWKICFGDFMHITKVGRYALRRGQFRFSAFCPPAPTPFDELSSNLVRGCSATRAFIKCMIWGVKTLNVQKMTLWHFWTNFELFKF